MNNIVTERELRSKCPEFANGKANGKMKLYANFVGAVIVEKFKRDHPSFCRGKSNNDIANCIKFVKTVNTMKHEAAFLQAIKKASNGKHKR